ncbi:unnamed protein product [Thelazia callipaeda]|uniref:LRRcap domain-containing protein n=1 Tax=Thelazia callipaeda TaxID=103827 RepID=A0A0N5D542_THECL|nr:unnamed protein product [Thelazia callipaeda]
MDKRIELELRGRNRSEVTELNLDNCRATAVTGLTTEFTSLETLSMINVGLTSLKGLPALPSLQRLDLSENRISGNLDQLLCCPNIKYLNLAGNKISTLEALEPLKKLEVLRSLDLFGCELAAAEDYRKNVFEMITSLKYLDGYDVQDEEAESDSEILEETIDDEEEDVGGEVLVDSDNDDEGNGDEEDSEVGLDYLQGSTVMQDEDETEDFAPSDEEETDEASTPKGVKRKYEHEDEEENATKTKREA